MGFGRSMATKAPAGRGRWHLFVAANLVAVYVDNKNPRFGERALVGYLASLRAGVHGSADGGGCPLVLPVGKSGLCAHHCAVPIPGQIYFYNPKNADRPNRFVSSEQVELYKAKPEWQEIWRSEEPRRLAGVVMEQLGLASRVPQSLLTKLDRPNPAVRVFMVTR